MNDEFLITGERLDIIAKTFGVGKDDVKRLHKEFGPLESEVKNHHLAHMSRVMEHFFKKETGNSDFYIEFKPYRVNVPNQRSAMSQYDRVKKFTIYFDSKLTVREVRVNIAHELGHLYLFARYWDENSGMEYNPKFEATTEPLSSILGIFILSDKNHFYETLPSSGLQHDDWKNLLDDFDKLAKKTQ